MIGTELGPYRILEQVGVGGMTTVYKAFHAPMDRYVALKVLPEQMGRDAALRGRFQQEARVVAQLEHTHILPVYDFGETKDRLYLVMRYVPTGTLKAYMRAGPLDLPEVGRILKQVGEALAYAHRQDVVHRDVKPSNVLLDAQGDCYLTDFGLAKVLASSINLTGTGVGLGTPAYMSPEQGQGKEIDARSDIYSLGVVLYEMVTGRVPYEAETPMAVVLKHITAQLPLPREVKHDVPLAVERVILKALAKDPDDRFQTVEELVNAFEAAIGPSDADASASDEAVMLPIESSESRGRERLTRTVTNVHARLPGCWKRGAAWAAGGLFFLLVFFLALSRLPFQVRVNGGRLEVLRLVAPETPTVAVNLAPTPGEAPTAKSTATTQIVAAVESTGTPRPTASSTATLSPKATATGRPTDTPVPPTPSQAASTEIGDALFVDSGQRLGDSRSLAVALGDVDGDGDLDAFVGNGHGSHPIPPSKVWLNDGGGRFSDSGQNLGALSSEDVALGDLDGDGDLDALVGNHGANEVWLNDGVGGFRDSGQNLGGSMGVASMAVALADLDGDGDLDAFIGNSSAYEQVGHPNTVWLNDGAGNFSDSGQSLGDLLSLDVALGDVDGDGDLDAVVANGEKTSDVPDPGEPNKVWLNDGTGTFSDSGQNLGHSLSHALDLGDVDGDGDLDALVGNAGADPDTVWLNDGAGHFSDSGQNLNENVAALALEDLDGDGDLDAFVGTYSDYDRVWLNDGAGRFRDSGQRLGGFSESRGLALGDLDGDGDIDAFAAAFGWPVGRPNGVWLNQTVASSPISTLLPAAVQDPEGDFVATSRYGTNDDAAGEIAALYAGADPGPRW